MLSRRLLHLSRRLYSTEPPLNPLLVLGHDRTTMANVVKPDLDVEHRLGRDPEHLERDLRDRGIDPASIDLKKLRLSVGYFALAEKEKDAALEAKEKFRLQVKEQQEVLEGLSGGPEVGVVKRRLLALFESSKAATSDLKDALKTLEDLEKVVYVELMKLPCPLDEEVPRAESDRVLWIGDHVTEPMQQAVVDAPSCPPEPLAFKEGRLAMIEFDLGARWRQFQREAQEARLLEAGTLVSGPDFARSVVVAGCGADWASPDSELSLKPSGHVWDERSTGQGMHLTGSAALFALAGFLCKNTVQRPANLPHAFFSEGRRYRPRSVDDKTGCAGVSQSTEIQYLGVERSLDQPSGRFRAAADALFGGFLGKELGLPVRLVETRANGLELSEARRLLAQVFDGGAWHQAGWLSRHGDWISSRLMLKERETATALRNLHIYSGCALDVSKVAKILWNREQES